MASHSILRQATFLRRIHHFSSLKFSAPSFNRWYNSEIIDISTEAQNLNGMAMDVKAAISRHAPLPEDRLPTPEIDDKIISSTQRGRVRDSTIPWPKFLKNLENTPQERIVLDLKEAIKILRNNAKAKFDETVEVHVKLGIDPKRSDQMVRGAVTLPFGSGKNVRVAVFAEGQAAEEAKASGADVVGADDLIAEIKKSGGKLDFEKCIAVPYLMSKLGQIARILGPRGMMPNPKVGTVTNDVGQAVKDMKKGRVDFRADKTGNVHAGIGKVSFSDDALLENISAFSAALLAAKPLGLKKSSRFMGYFLSFYICSTMGKGIKISIQSVSELAEAYLKKST